MKKKVILGLITTATLFTLISAQALTTKQNKSYNDYKTLLTQANSGIKTNEAVVINGNNKLNLYSLPTGKGVSSYISTGEMLTILGNTNGYYKVKVHETGAIGYINPVNMKVILNCENCELTSLKGEASIVNVSSVVNLRQSAGINSSVVGTLTNGSSVKLLGRQGDWYKVNVNGTIGFIFKEYLVISKIQSSNNTNSTNNSSISKQTNINTNSTQSSSNSVVNKIAYITNIQPDSNSAVVTSLNNPNIQWQVNNGQQVNILGEKGDSYKIYYPYVGTGYVNKKYITFKNNQNQIHPNDNKLVSKYFGTWTVGKQIGFAVGQGAYTKSYKGKKIILTKNLFSFNGWTVKNPNYYIVTESMWYLFGFSKDNYYGDLKYNKADQVQLILALPHSKKLTNQEFINYVRFPQCLLISGNSLVTFGGGQSNSSLNQCIKDN